jgi:hypothetical protein
MRVVARALLALLLVAGAASLAARAQAPAPSALRIQWEAANRFRLFARSDDFDRQAAAWAALGPERSVLGLERSLALATGGKGWSAEVVDRLCLNRRTGRVMETCVRDGIAETYVNPRDHAVRLSATATAPLSLQGARCVWMFAEGASKRRIEADCSQQISNRIPSKAGTRVDLEAALPDGTSLTATATVQVRDVLVVGLGDSIASGEGNPDEPIRLKAQGFCFRRLFGASPPQYWRPSRDVSGITFACPPPLVRSDEPIWNAERAGWAFAGCHRSLYSHQTRTALALALENPQMTVTYLPLGCTGATISEGLLGAQRARERPQAGRQIGPRFIEGQISQLETYLGARRGRRPLRKADLVLLTIGANDIGFSGLVANVVIDRDPERKTFQDLGQMTTPAQSGNLLRSVLNRDFPKLRRVLGRFTADLGHVAFTLYGNPAMKAAHVPCGSGREGFDVHPAFAVSGTRNEAAVEFVEDVFIPRLRSLAGCAGDGGCADPARQRMQLVEGHRPAFEEHGFCAIDATTDPAFDRDCFRNGSSFDGPFSGPLTCGRDPGEFAAYASRARWIRTANDSYFAAMTYPYSMGPLRPADIHDALWGVASAVYGGAIHPTAEGHAAMADAALVAARAILGPAPPAAGPTAALPE